MFYVCVYWVFCVGIGGGGGFVGWIFIGGCLFVDICLCVWMRVFILNDIMPKLINSVISDNISISMMRYIFKNRFN
jgi:hypothetical protein